jgi:hypothetical protein
VLAGPDAYDGQEIPPTSAGVLFTAWAKLSRQEPLDQDAHRVDSGTDIRPPAPLHSHQGEPRCHPGQQVAPGTAGGADHKATTDLGTGAGGAGNPGHAWHLGDWRRDSGLRNRRLLPVRTSPAIR